MSYRVSIASLSEELFKLELVAHGAPGMFNLRGSPDGVNESWTRIYGQSMLQNVVSSYVLSIAIKFRTLQDSGKLKEETEILDTFGEDCSSLVEIIRMPENPKYPWNGKMRWIVNKLIHANKFELMSEPDAYYQVWNGKVRIEGDNGKWEIIVDIKQWAFELFQFINGWAPMKFSPFQ